MRAAIVNNGKIRPERLITLLQGFDISVFSNTEIEKVVSEKFDLIVLSGSSSFPIVGNEEKLEKEMELVRTSAVPLLGICYGAQLINVAFGGTLRDMGVDQKLREVIEVEVVADESFFQGRTRFMAYDAHHWVIDSTPPELEVVARSVHGPEIIRHRSRPMYGFQVHPEKFPDESYGDELYASFNSKHMSLV